MRNASQLDTWLRETGTRVRWLAREVGVSNPYIVDLRYGRRTPGADVAARIEAATGGAVGAASWGAADSAGADDAAASVENHTNGGAA